MGERPPLAGLPRLGHAVIKVSDQERALAFCRATLGLSDHRVSQSIYLRDPDRLLIELYADADPAIWRADPAAVAHVAPLSL